MPQPSAQSCANCQFIVVVGTKSGECRIDSPKSPTQLAIAVPLTYWCGEWKPITQT